ncbi:hypothetical protein QBC39DRAFT_300789 [Podospora conica]|nr:hypothetical protein QBC39DRAFT_300789 [Schizothecium conicum]
MSSLLRAALLSAPLLARLATAEPVQYCKTGYADGQADFCVALATYHNATADAWDVYLSMTVPRSSPLGWTAVGTGPAMAGSLMFIVYGDPTLPPVLSIRTSAGHHQPAPLNESNTPLVLPPRASLSVLHAKWHPVHLPRHGGGGDDANYPIKPTHAATHVASVKVACYGCGHPALLPPSSDSHPFIWAWNDRQDFNGAFPADAHLAMHRHASGGGGFGTFYVDLARSHAEGMAFAPTVQAGMDRVGTSDAPMGGVGGVFKALRDRPLVKLHGLLMGVVFMVVFPLGVVVMRMPGSGGGGFKRHWKVQVAGSGMAVMGAVVAGVMTGGGVPRTGHQWVGVGVVGALVVQGVLGWRHHVGFVKGEGRKGWVTRGHVWLGRVVLAAGWVNVVMGMGLSGHGWVGMGVVGGLAVLEAVGVWVVVWRARRRGEGPVLKVEGHALMERDGGDADYFVLEMTDDEFGSDAEGRREGKDLEKRKGDDGAAR